MKSMLSVSIFSALFALNASAGGASGYKCDWMIPDFKIAGNSIESAELVISMVADLQVSAGGKRYETRCENKFEANNWDKFSCVLDESTTAIVRLSENKSKCTVELQ